MAGAEKLGKGPCPHCGEAVMFKRSSGGKLTFNCDDCDSSGYTEPGGVTYKKWSATITARASDAPAPAPAPSDPPPAAKRKAEPFSLAGLGQ